MNYDLSHLDQSSTLVYGPIQDDEALFLFALIRCMGLKYIVEVGGLHGYSARNFLKAINLVGKVITIDPLFLNLYEIPEINLTNHAAIIKFAHDVSPEELPIPYIDLLFFDAHDYDSQILFFNKMSETKLITDKTLVVLHDTGCAPMRLYDEQILFSGPENSNNGYVSSPLLAERRISNYLTNKGYQAMHVSANNNCLPEYIQTRHGITILYKPYSLLT
jgi:hypothetical protein